MATSLEDEKTIYSLKRFGLIRLISLKRNFSIHLSHNIAYKERRMVRENDSYRVIKMIILGTNFIGKDKRYFINLMSMIN